MKTLEDKMCKYCIAITFIILILEICLIVPVHLGIIIQCSLGIIMGFEKMLKFIIWEKNVKTGLLYLVPIVMLIIFIFII